MKKDLSQELSTRRQAVLELANGGTIFLDEIANLGYDIQVEPAPRDTGTEDEKSGGTKDIGLDVRIIIASNEKLWDAAQKGKFRKIFSIASMNSPSNYRHCASAKTISWYSPTTSWTGPMKDCRKM